MTNTPSLLKPFVVGPRHCTRLYHFVIAVWRAKEVSSSTNAVSFSSARTTKRFPSPRCASAIQIVRPLQSTAETQPQLQPRLLRLRAIISQYFTSGLLRLRFPFREKEAFAEKPPRGLTVARVNLCAASARRRISSDPLQRLLVRLFRRERSDDLLKARIAAEGIPGRWRNLENCSVK